MKKYRPTILLGLLVFSAIGCGLWNKQSASTQQIEGMPSGTEDVIVSEKIKQSDGLNNANGNVMTDMGLVDSQIVWLDFESGYAKAITEKKMLLVDAYTDWCGWCKVMERETYSDKKVIKKVNTHFVTVKLNPEKSRTYKFGDSTMEASELYLWLGNGKSNGFPSTFFMVKPGKTDERYTAVGHIEAKEFMNVLDQVIAKRN